jgi:hypothetical protein
MRVAKSPFTPGPCHEYIRRSAYDAVNVFKHLGRGATEDMTKLGRGSQGVPNYPIVKVRRVEGGGCGLGGRKDV